MMSTVPMHRPSDLQMERALPNQIFAERAVLSCIFLWPDECLASIAARLKPEDFFRDSHARIYRAMLALYRQGTEITTGTVVSSLSDDELEMVGRVAGISEIYDYGGTPTEVIPLCERIIEARVLRDVIQLSQDTMEAAFCGEPADELLNGVQRSAMELRSRTGKSGIVRAGDLIHEVAAELLAEADDPDFKRKRIFTGIDEVDRISFGFEPADFVVVGAAPSSGKTAISFQAAFNAAERHQKNVVYFSLEMTSKALLRRGASQVGGISANSIKARFLNEQERRKLADATSRINFAPLYLRDVGKATPATLRNELRVLQSQLGRVDMVVVDYLQRMESDKAGKSRREEVGSISRELKNIAKEFNCVMLVLSQLNRAGYDRPQMSSLRESGDIEADADHILLMWANEKPRDGFRDVNFDYCKQRDGMTGEFSLVFDTRYLRFCSPDPYLDAPPVPEMPADEEVDNAFPF